MKFNLNKMMFMMILFLSIIIAMSSINWISLWMSMEINMMMFIPMIMKKYNNKMSESMMMYFLIQSMSSMIFMFTILMNFKILYSMENKINFYLWMMTMSIMMKMGASPFHFWIIDIMKNMDWISNMFMVTLQKFIPLMIMSLIISNYMIYISMMSVIMGAIGGINQTSIKKLMGFSSINHMGWMLMSMMINNELWIKYYLIYIMMTVYLLIMFNKLMINHINQININFNMLTKMNFMIMMMSMGGLPPLIGFIPKLMVINNLMKMNMYMTTLIMILMSMLTLYYYMRMIMPFMLMNSTMNKWMINYNIKNYYMIIINMMMPMVSMMMI